MIFKSQQVNLDPEPWLGANGARDAREDPFTPGEHRPRFAPRPVGPQGQIFEPTRDPAPWRYFLNNGEEDRNDDCTPPALEWAPRREQFDTPVNPILEGFRADDADETWPEKVRGWLNGGLMGDGYATTAEVAHAVRVLTRLANWNGANA